MSELTPITRVESYLDAIVNNGIPPTEDITRIETFLQAIYDNQVCSLTPITRIEMFLGKISGQDIVLPEPITRIELYLAAIAGEDVELPENPITRLEMYLAEWADSGDWTTISGAIVEFIAPRAHKLKSCVVNLFPQQDLHGYDSPWPEGGGKNLFPLPTTAKTKSGVTVEATANGEIWVHGTPTITSGYIAFELPQITSAITGNPATISINEKIVGIGFDTNIGGGSLTFTMGDTATVKTSVASSVSGPSFVNVRYDIGTIDKKFKIQLEIGNTATAFAPFSNICPISGWPGVSVQKCGKNLADMINDGYVPSISTGELVPYSGSRSQFIKVSPNTAYTASFEHNTYNVIFEYDINKAFIRSTSGYSTITVTTTATTEYVMLRCDLPVGVTAIPNCQFELGSIASAYEPFNGNSYSVTFGKTVYGGDYDFIDGKGQDGLVKLNMADISTWALQPDIGRIYVLRPDLEPWPDSSTPAPDLLCNRFKTLTFEDLYLSQKEGVALSPGGALQFHINGLTDVESTTLADVIAYFAANETYVIAKLATPITIQLTPQQVTALKGYNAVWSDAGDVTVTVRGEPVVEPDVQPLQALNLLLGGAYHNAQTPDDVSDEDALEIILGGENE